MEMTPTKKSKNEFDNTNDTRSYIKKAEDQALLIINIDRYVFT